MKRSILLLASFFSIMPLVAEIQPSGFIENRIKELKGIYYGITPSWVPHSIFWGAGASLYTLKENIKDSANGVAIQTGMDNIPFAVNHQALNSPYLALTAGVCSAVIIHLINANKPENIIKRAQALLTSFTDLEHGLFVEKLYHDSYQSNYNNILGSISMHPYYLVDAANKLATAHKGVCFLLEKCKKALLYSNASDYSLQDKLSVMVDRLVASKEIIEHNSVFIKNVCADNYHTQLRLIASDKSAQAQVVQAQSRKSLKNLAWIAWIKSLFTVTIQ